jgi:hypothetical protein
MARTKKQRKIEAKDQREGKRILTIILITTIVLVSLMYLVFQNS